MNINFWESSGGRHPAMEFILEQGGEEAERLQQMLGVVESGTLQVLTHTKTLKKLTGEKRLYELRVRVKRIQYRFTCYVIGDEIWLLEGMKKKRMKLVAKYLKTARTRASILSMKLRS